MTELVFDSKEEAEGFLIGVANLKKCSDGLYRYHEVLSIATAFRPIYSLDGWVVAGKAPGERMHLYNYDEKSGLLVKDVLIA
jgi:hypothetical protein